MVEIVDSMFAVRRQLAVDRLTNMEAFVRVVNAGSFTTAAQRWGLSKAAVSKYIGALEAHLGVELLRRTTRSLSLTDAGAQYYDRCLVLLEDIESLEAGLRDAHVQARGILRITAPPGFMSRYGELITSEFSKQNSEVKLEVTLTHRMLDLVEEGIDVAIRVTSPKDSSLVARRLAAAPIVAVASPQYLQVHGRPMVPRDLLSHSCLCDSNFRDRNRWRFRHAGSVETVEVDGPFTINSPTAILSLAVAHHGIALVPRFVAESALKAGLVESVLDGMPAFDWAIYALYPRRRYLSGRVRAFVDFLAEHIHDEPN